MKEAIIKLHQLQVLVLALVGVILFTSCATSIPPYYPKVSLDVSPQKIKKTVRFDGIVDISPEKDKARLFAGHSVIYPKIFAEDLGTEVTNEITKDFRVNGLFQNVSINAKRPDFVIKGEIIKYRGISKINDVTYIGTMVSAAVGMGLIIASVSFHPVLIPIPIPTIDYPVLASTGFLMMTVPFIIPFFGVPYYTQIIDIEIVLNVYDNHNKLIGTYTGKESSIDKTSIYNNTNNTIGRNTNKALSKVVMQIREQILKDIYKYN